MFTSIKTTSDNKEVVTHLTRRLNLGAENVIARLAYSYSLACERKLNLQNAGNARGKEYTKKILFGDFTDIYISMICVHYNLYKSDKDIPKYIKMHVDDGLELIDAEVRKNPNITGIDFIVAKIERGLKALS